MIFGASERTALFVSVMIHYSETEAPTASEVSKNDEYLKRGIVQ